MLMANGSAALLLLLPINTTATGPQFDGIGALSGRSLAVREERGSWRHSRLLRLGRRWRHQPAAAGLPTSPARSGMLPRCPTTSRGAWPHCPDQSMRAGPGPALQAQVWRGAADPQARGWRRHLQRLVRAEGSRRLSRCR
jgi:hypothetical protein